MIKEWLETYKPKNKTEALQALREIMQETAQAGYTGQVFLKKRLFMVELPCAYFMA